MSFSQKQVQWQHAFYEWHLHRTDDTAADELKARKQLLSIIQKNRRKKQQWTVGEVAQQFWCMALVSVLLTQVQSNTDEHLQTHRSDLRQVHS